MADSSFPEFIDLDDDDVDEGNSASLSTGNARMGNKATKLSKTLGSNAVQGDMLPDVLDDLAMQAQTTKAACVKSLIAVFPGISREYVSQMYEAEADKGFGLADLLVEKILSASTSAPYPREAEKTRKRKRQSDARPAAQHHLQYESAQRGPVTSRYHELAKDILGDEFPFMPLAYIESVLLVHRYVFQSYMQLKKAEAAPDSQQLSPYKKLKSARQPKERRKRGSRVEAEAHSKSLHPPEDKTLKDLIQEMDTARNKFRQDDEARQAEKAASLAELENEKEHQEAGLMMECRCCFDEFPLNRMTHCDGDVWHFFCFECGRRNAQNEVGLSRYVLKCMDESGCQAKFANDEVLRFVDLPTMQLLSRLQQQEELRMAEIEDLTKCPFCDFAAVCEPVEVDREFSCQAEECMRVTCRLCQKESHLPLSCEDNSKENHITIRHALEEARTEALVRSCRKCQNKFIKESGCNKMTCPRCRNVQCYICNKSINHYSHFAERSTQADSSGLCPLYDDTDQRHEKEVADAEKVALEKLKKADPNIEEEKLKIQVSKAVMMDDQKRRLGGKNRPGNGGPIIPNPGAAPHPMNPAARNANAGYQRPARQQYDGAFDFDLDAGPPNDLPFFDIVQHLDFAQDVPGTVNGQPHPHSRPPANLQLDDGRYRARAHIPPQNAYLPFQHLPHLPFHLRAAGVRPPIRESGMQRNPILIADHDQQARVPTNEAARGTVRQPYEYNPQMDRVQPTNQVHIPPYPARGFAQAQDAQLPQAENYNARTHMAHEIQNPRRNAIAEQDLIMPAPFLTGQRLHGDPDRLWL